MNENPYQAPKSDIEIKNESPDNQYYVVSINKFTILFFATAGVYSIYWFYKNWKEHKTYHGTSIWPVARGIFSIFFAHSLFGEVRKTLTATVKQFDWNPSVLATAYVVLSIIAEGLNRMSMKEVGSPYTDVLSILILPLIYFTLVNPQKAINLSQGDPEGSSNSTFTGANYAWIALGAVYWVLLLMILLSYWEE